MKVNAQWTFMEGRKTGVQLQHTDSTQTLLIYTDGAARITGVFGQATWALIAADGRQARGWVESEAGAPQNVGATRNTIVAGELTAILFALRRAKEVREKYPERRIVIRYDSQEAQAQATGNHRGKEHTLLQGRMGT